MLRDEYVISYDTDNDNRQKYSPLFYIKFPLTLFSSLHCFFPLTPTSILWNDFKFYSFKAWIQYAFIVLLWLTPFPYVFWYMTTEYSYTVTGVNLLSPVDIFLFGAITCLGPLVLQVSYLIVYQKHSKNIGDLQRKISDITFRQNHYFGIYDAQKAAKAKSQNMIGCLLMLETAMIGLSAVFNYLDQQCFNEQAIPTTATLVMISLTSINIFFGAYTLMVKQWQ